MRGQIFICDGSIVHSESGVLSGEVALYGLLALRRGEFNLLPYSEPQQRTINGHWEFLLMEAARLSDEAAGSEAGSDDSTAPSPAATTARSVPVPDRLPDAPIFQRAPPALPSSPAASPPVPAMVAHLAQVSAPPRPAPPPAAIGQVPVPFAFAMPLAGSGHVRIEEVVLCSGAGEVLYDWECKSLERRLRLLQQIEQQASQLTMLAPAGRFDRLEIQTAEGRIVCGVQLDMRVFVRTATTRSPAA